ncbi:MAG TPA: hypothetical protein VFZ78_11185 [Flavisolibacter sp.]
MLLRLITFPLLVLLASCNSTVKPQQTPDKSPATATGKPPATTNDTLRFSGRTAVFFQPDSLQLLRIREKIPPAQAASGEHEAFYQMRYSKIYLGTSWPDVVIRDVRDVRYLLFEAGGGKQFMIDLNTQDPYGLFVFDGKQPPRLMDMTNVETYVTDYFK